MACEAAPVAENFVLDEMHGREVQSWWAPAHRPFAGMFAAEKACMLLLQNQQRVRCDINSKSFKLDLLDVVRTCAKRVPYEESDIMEAEEVQSANEVLVGSLDQWQPTKYMRRTPHLLGLHRCNFFRNTSFASLETA